MVVLCVCLTHCHLYKLKVPTMCMWKYVEQLAPIFWQSISELLCDQDPPGSVFLCCCYCEGDSLPSDMFIDALIETHTLGKWYSRPMTGGIALCWNRPVRNCLRWCCMTFCRWLFLTDCCRMTRMFSFMFVFALLNGNLISGQLQEENDWSRKLLNLLVEDYDLIQWRFTTGSELRFAGHVCFPCQVWWCIWRPDLFLFRPLLTQLWVFSNIHGQAGLIRESFIVGLFDCSCYIV